MIVLRKEGAPMGDDTTTATAKSTDMQNSADLVRLLLNSTGEGIYGTDMEGNCTFANSACLKLLGFEKDTDLLGKHMHNLVHHTRPDGEPYPVEECRIYQSFREHEGVHVEDEIMICADGSSFSAEYWSYPVEQDGEFVGCVVTFTDITERLKVEAELRQTAEMVRSLLNSTGEGIYGTDMDGNCTFANPACLKLLGFEKDTDLLGKHMHNLVHHTRPNGDSYPVEECRIYQSFREHEGVHVEDEIMICADGSNFPAEYWSYPVEREGELVGCVVTFVDISDRLKVEEELRQTEKMAAIGKLSAGLAHELNNPAAAAGRASGQLLDTLSELQSATLELTRAGLHHDLWGALVEWDQMLQRRSGSQTALSALEASDHEEKLIDWLMDHNVDDEWEHASTLVGAGVETDDLDRLATTVPKEALGKAVEWLCKSFTTQDLANAVVKSSQSISKLVEAAKSFSYMDQATIQLIDVHSGIEDTITVLGSRINPGIEIVRDYSETIPRIEVPASELNQVWMNLMENAIEAVGQDGTITIVTAQEGDNITVTISDNGPGIPQDIQSRVFDPFFTTKDVGEGAGLGLDVVRRVVRNRCNGEVGFNSQPGETTFWVRLPLLSAK